jgi:glycosyltransferase involved in cell wall biosynthesis
MKLLNVNPFINPYNGGGTAERTLQMSLYLAKQGVDCSILTLDLDITDEIKEKLENVKIVALACLVKRYFIPSLKLKLVSNLVKEADLIHLMNHWTFLNVWIYFLARYHRVPYVICPAGALINYGRSKWAKSLFNFLIGKRIIKNASARIAIAENEFEHFESYGTNRKEVNLLPNAIDRVHVNKDDLNSFLKNKNLAGKKYILFMGRLNKIKGIDLLVEAFCQLKQELNEFDLVIAGTDEGMLPELEKVAKDAGLKEKIHFLGFLGGKDKFLAYKGAEFLAIPSRHEAMSIVLLEAGILGTPVLLTDQCGLNELKNFKGTKIVSPSVNGIKEGLIYFDSKKDQFDKMGALLEDYVEEHYLWERMILKYVKLFKLTIKEYNKSN